MRHFLLWFCLSVIYFRYDLGPVYDLKIRRSASVLYVIALLGVLLLLLARVED